MVTAVVASEEGRARHAVELDRAHGDDRRQVARVVDGAHRELGPVGRAG
jgi:hypothetical protein